MTSTLHSPLLKKSLRTGMMRRVLSAGLATLAAVVTLHVGAVVTSVATDTPRGVWETTYAATDPAAAPAADPAAAGAADPAAGTTTPPQNTQSVADPFSVLTELLNGCIQIFSMLLSPILMLVSWLLTPDWVMGDIFGLRPMLYSLWVLVSNVVYVIFAGMLVAMAFMNIFGNKSYQLKEKLPKFVVGLLIVPLSWFIVSATLSVTSILTASIMGIPYSMIDFQGGAVKDFTQAIKIPTECSINLGSAIKSVTSAGGADGATTGTGAQGFTCSDDDAKKTTLYAMLKGKGAYNLLQVYAYGIFKVQDYTKITNKNHDAITKISDITTQAGLDVIFFIAFAIIVFALFFAMLMRAFILWAFVIFSPVFGLLHFMEFKNANLKSLSAFSITNFLSLALVPVYVAAALAFGILFISVTMGQSIGESSSSFCTPTGTDGGATQKLVCGGMTLNIQGIPVGNESFVGQASNLAFGFIGKVMINFLALAVLWIGVMAALQSSELTKSAVAPFVQFGQSIGGIVKEMPSYLPIVPAPKFEDGKTGMGTISSAALGNAANQIASGIRGQRTTPPKSFMDVMNKATGTDPVRSSLAQAGQLAATNVTQYITNTTTATAGQIGDKVREGMQRMVSATNSELTLEDMFSKYHHEINQGVQSMLSAVEKRFETKGDTASKDQIGQVKKAYSDSHTAREFITAIQRINLTLDARKAMKLPENGNIDEQSFIQAYGLKDKNAGTTPPHP